MTCIVAVAEGGRVWLGGDNAGFVGGTILQHSNGKVFHSGEYVMGCAGNRRFSDIARYAFVPPPVKGDDLDRHMAVAFVDALRESLRSKGYLQTHDGQETADGENGDGMVVGVRGAVCHLASDFTCVRVVDGLWSIGCGSELALGALYVTEREAPEARILRALAAAERYSDGVVGPFKVISTELPKRRQGEHGKAAPRNGRGRYVKAGNKATEKAWKAMHAEK